MENISGVQGNGLSPQEGTSLGDKFKLTKQLVAELRSDIRNLAPNSKSLKEFGATFDMGSEVGMTKVNTADSTRIQAPPELGKGGLVDEVF
ncbi:uncharacterized protein METZ01_LOCUS442646 [marine metagenome]|uniref:Uncharacterized protein n=1 Tax=marine metagenome TaxID=408172 RepID=A0A382Z2Q3_9ZZZZ